MNDILNYANTVPNVLNQISLTENAADQIYKINSSKKT